MTIARYSPPLNRLGGAVVDTVGRPVLRAGHFVYFLAQVGISIPFAVVRYRREFFRHLTDIAWGNGSVVVGGGTVAVAVVLGVTTGALAGVEGYNALNLLGLGSATGMLAAFAITRELAPIMLGLAFTTQAGCRFTAQLGAMRINDELDAVESLAIRPIPYLVSTRVTASAVASIPLLVVCLAITYLACEAVVQLTGNAPYGTYMHYFSLFINPVDVFYALVKATLFVFVSSTVQCYFGYFASGGPAGVGVAAGHAMRAAIVVTVVLNMLLTMGLWGIDSGARFGG